MPVKDRRNGKDEFEWTSQPWTQEEVNALHEMVQEYSHAKWLRKQVYKWLIWVLGLPAFALTVWEPLVRLWGLLKKLFVAG